MGALILLFVVLGIWFKIRDNDFQKYRRTLIVNVAGFMGTACLVLMLNFQRSMEVGINVCSTGFGPALVGLAIYRSYRAFRGQNESMGCLAPVVLYFQFVLILVLGVGFMKTALEGGAGGNILSALMFVGLMASLGIFHAWAGPILAGFNIGAGLAGMLSGQSTTLFWTNIFEWMNLGPSAQWIWICISTTMSLSTYWEKLFDQNILDHIADKLTLGSS